MRQAIVVLGLLLQCFLCFAKDMSALVLSDIHLDVNSKHAMELAPHGVSHLNDMDFSTYQAMIARLKAEVDAGSIDNPTYIFLLGDLVGHFRHSKDAVSSGETLVLSTLKHYFPNTPVVYAFGNNDSFVANYGSFLSPAQQSPLQLARAVWPPKESGSGFVWANPQCTQPIHYPCVIKSDAEDGYYSTYLADNLRVIALNTVLFSTHVHAEAALQAGQKQLGWLADQLIDAHQHKDSVLLLMHIPPGNQVYQNFWNWSSLAFWRDADLQEFLRLVSVYHDEIIGILAGHTHKDELKIIRSAEHQALMGVYMNGSLASIYGNAPSVRSYLLHEDNQQWYIKDYVVYQFYEREASQVALRRLYRYRDYYCTHVVQSINDCLLNVTPEKMQRYYTVGNQAYTEALKHPEHFVVEVK